MIPGSGDPGAYVPARVRLTPEDSGMIAAVCNLDDLDSEDDFDDNRPSHQFRGLDSIPIPAVDTISLSGILRGVSFLMLDSFIC